MGMQERRKHLEQALSEGGSIMTARGSITKQMPSSAALARTPEDRQAAREEIRRRARELEAEARMLGLDPGDFGDDEDDGNRLDARAQGSAGRNAVIVRDGTGDELSEDYPGREALVRAGYTARAQVDGLSEEELATIPGIGPATVSKIMDERSTRGVR